ncbi:MAG TPA: hypothetical protein VJW73_09595 [Gemmatimonadaceae bacterium]|nr:hypothetical protein [Gemmatimonadaceae bacterium]
MSRLIASGIACVACFLITITSANAQRHAPIPRQVLDAKSVLIANGASESYGAESYFELTLYDGGPNRAYNSFYSAVQEWGHFDLVGQTSDADLVLVIKFANPVVGREGDRNADRRDWVYDPQLNLSINDPRTGLPLWTITEHLEPGGNHAEANRRFDEAVTRLVADLQRLILQPNLATETDNPPPGAIATARRKAHERHAAAGLLLGFTVGGIIAMKDAGGHDPCADLGNFDGCVASGKRQARNQIMTGLGLALVGALVGWAWPVDY